MRLLWSVEHGLQIRSKWMEATLGITGPQRLVLRIVTRRPGLSAGELAHILHLHPSTITGIVQRLVSKQLVQRRRDPTDSRRVRLRARDRAHVFISGSPGTVEHAVTRALTHVPVRDVRVAKQVLSAVADALADDGRSRTSIVLKRRRRTRRRTRLDTETKGA
jgi:DNA-binding MarR family transcriptional regulator